jgi:probable HAF family extracellular repeat protein
MARCGGDLWSRDSSPSDPPIAGPQALLDPDPAPSELGGPSGSVGPAIREGGEPMNRSGRGPIARWRGRITVFAVVVAAFVAPTPGSAAAASIQYRVDDLGVLAGDFSSVATGINASGQVVGWSSGPAGTRAFLFTDGIGMVALSGPTGRPVTIARDINDLGVVVGSASSGGTDLGHAVRWTGGVAQDLGTLGTGLFSEAKAVNASGATVGYSYTNGGGLLGIHAFLTSGTGLTDLTPSTDTAYAEGINSSGQIAGAKNGRAFRWTNGVFTDLGVPTGFLQSYGFAINDEGQVVGHVVSPTGISERIFRYTDGQGMVILGGVGSYNRAAGINAAGDVIGVGRPTTSTLGQRAFLFTDGNGMVDLNTLIDPTSGWVLLGAGGINDSGQISAWGTNNLTGARHALRLTPVDAPGDITKPTISFVTPVDGATVTGNVNVSIVASDDVAVTQVTFLVDGVAKSVTTNSGVLTYRWSTRKVAIGPHLLTAQAVDGAGNQASQTITVTVQR